MVVGPDDVGKYVLFEFELYLFFFTKITLL